MYGDQLVDVVLEFGSKLIGAVYDKFGEDTKKIRSSKNKCVATVKLQISTVFWEVPISVKRGEEVLNLTIVPRAINSVK